MRKLTQGLTKFLKAEQGHAALKWAAVIGMIVLLCIAVSQIMSILPSKQNTGSRSSSIKLPKWLTSK